MANHAGLQKFVGFFIARVEYLVGNHRPIVAGELAVCDNSHLLTAKLGVSDCFAEGLSETGIPRLLLFG
jgi:hypothetical protein